MPENTRTRLIRPDVGVGGGLDDLGEQRALGVAGQAGDRLAVGRGHRGQRVLSGRRERLGHHLEQLGHADPLRRGRGEHRVEAAPRDRLLQVLDEHLGRRSSSPDRYRSMRDSSSLSG